MRCVNVPNFVQIGQADAETWPFSIFQNGGRPPVRFGGPIRHRANFCAIGHTIA